MIHIENNHLNLKPKLSLSNKKKKSKLNIFLGQYVCKCGNYYRAKAIYNYVKKIIP